MSKTHNKDYKPEDIRYPEQTIENTDLVVEMKTAYIDYAMSVIVGRALPDVRDGLKPVHRRILYAMYEERLTHDKPFKKSATCVGDVLGRYHPHGEMAVYDALVRLAQDFSMRYPLVEGHGNFGSVDGDPPAAQRYTEARASKICSQMLRDMDRETVDFKPNFDESREEPIVLPSRFPNLLVNGSSGIAVGMATNIPPHNLREVIGACICVLENPEADLKELMQHVKGPDFPTRGIIMGRSGIRAAYKTGRGRIVMRARTHVENFGQNRERIIVTELPYQVNKRTLIENIAQQVRDKKIEGVSGLRDESDRQGMRIVIEVTRGANPDVVLNRLMKRTQLQTSFSVNMLALVDRQSRPKLLSLREVIDEYLDFQKEIIYRRTEYDLRKARERAHILRGLLTALDHIDEVIKIIRESYDDAQERLMERFNLDEIQSRAILEMRLRALQGLDRERLETEFSELTERIKRCEEILGSEEILVNILKTELQEISDTYGDERWTEIRDVEYDIDIEDLIEEEECVFTLTKEGYIKRIECAEYRAQARGGRGVRAMTTKEEDYVETVFTASTHDVLLFFSDRGQVYKKKGYMVPSAGRQAKGMAIVNLLPLEKDEKISAVLHCRPEDLESYYVFMATAKGKVKRMNLSLLRNIRRTGIRALSIDEGDTLIGAMLTDGGERILLATRNGQAICFEETDVRPMGRTAAGVRGIRLRKGDECVGVCRWGSGRYLLSVSENGYGKRTPLRAYLRGGEAAQSRGGLGMRNFKLSEKTGKIAAAKVVNGDEDLLLVSDDGTMIRISVSEISVQGRSTQGVRVMRLSEGSLLISMAKTDPEEEIDCHDGVSLDEDPEFLEEDDFDEFEDEDIEEDELEEEFDDDDDDGDDDDDEEDDD